MSYISVQFGYNQSKLFNINCQIDPLLDSVADGCYKEMGKFMKKREEFFNKEIASFKKKEQALLKKLERLEPPKVVEPPKEEIKAKDKKARGQSKDKPKPGEKKKSKKELQKEEEERKKKEEEEKERLRKEEEERLLRQLEEEKKRKEEEEKKAKEKKGPPPKGKKGEEEKKEEPVIETEEHKMAREKIEVQAQIEELKKQMDLYSNKLKHLQDYQVKVSEEEAKPKVIELCEKTGERKHLKASGEQYATGLLRERKAYVLVQIKKGANEEDVLENIVIDGACIRTPEEDIKWEEE